MSKPNDKRSASYDFSHLAPEQAAKARKLAAHVESQLHELLEGPRSREAVTARAKVALAKTFTEMHKRGELGDDPEGQKALIAALTAEVQFVLYGRATAELFDFKGLLRSVPDATLTAFVSKISWPNLKPWWQLEWAYRQAELVGDWSFEWATDKDIRFDAQFRLPEPTERAEEHELRHDDQESD